MSQLKKPISHTKIGSRIQCTFQHIRIRTTTSPVQQKKPQNQPKTRTANFVSQSPQKMCKLKNWLQKPPSPPSRQIMLLHRDLLRIHNSNTIQNNPIQPQLQESNSPQPLKALRTVQQNENGLHAQTYGLKVETLKAAPLLPELNLFPRKTAHNAFLISVILSNITVSPIKVARSIV